MQGQIYFVTLGTAGRAPLFESWEVASEAARALVRLPLWERSRLLSWVLMPDHWHGLILLGDGVALPDCVRTLKGSIARQVRMAYPQLGAVWMQGYHEQPLHAGESLLATARYLILNPVRAGLVAHIGDYPFWDSVLGLAPARESDEYDWRFGVGACVRESVG